MFISEMSESWAARRWTRRAREESALLASGTNVILYLPPDACAQALPALTLVPLGSGDE